MIIDKQRIIDNICYTELVYGRINKKLKINYTKKQIESFVLKVLQETNFKYYVRRGKNYYVSNEEYNVRITINSFTYRIITADRLTS